MGLEDRDYFWEDRKRREEKYGSDFRGTGKKSFMKDVYYRPKEFRGGSESNRIRRSVGGWDGKGEKARPFSGTSFVIFILIGVLVFMGLGRLGFF